MKYLILIAIIYCLYHFLKGFYKGYKLSKFCNCSDSHLSVPGDSSTARCVYCGKPPRNELSIDEDDTYDKWSRGELLNLRLNQHNKLKKENKVEIINKSIGWNILKTKNEANIDIGDIVSISQIMGDGSGRNKNNCILIEGCYFTPRDLKLIK